MPSHTHKHKKNKQKSKLKKNKHERNYKPGDEKRRKRSADTISNGGNISQMRSNTAQTLTDPQGNQKPIKMAVVFNYDTLGTDIPQNELTEAISLPLKEGNHHSPVKLEFNSQNSPEKALTQSGTILNLRAKIGPIYCFSNEEPIDKPKCIRSLSQEFAKLAPTNNDAKKLLQEFKDSQAYQAIQEMSGDEKKQQITITSDLLKKTKREIKANDGKRILNQAQVVVRPGQQIKNASANKYAQAAGVFKVHVGKWEWLHLIAHMILGNKAQDLENLVAGKEFANTWMCFIEQEIPTLSKAYPDGFNLIINTSTIKNTHIGISMDYKIVVPETNETKGFELPFHFNLQENNKPHISFQKYISALVKTLIEKSKKGPTPHTPAKPNPPSSIKGKSATLFYSKKQQQQSAATVLAATTTATPTVTPITPASAKNKAAKSWGLWKKSIASPKPLPNKNLPPSKYSSKQKRKRS